MHPSTAQKCSYFHHLGTVVCQSAPYFALKQKNAPKGTGFGTPEIATNVNLLSGSKIVAVPLDIIICP